MKPLFIVLLSPLGVKVYFDELKKTRSILKNPREQIVDIVEGFSEVLVTSAESANLKLEVRGVLFAQYLENQDSNGRLAINCKAKPGIAFDFVDQNPVLFHIPKHLGKKGWLGIWVDQPNVNWSEIKAILFDAYRIVAPKSLLNNQP